MAVSIPMAVVAVVAAAGSAYGTYSSVQSANFQKKLANRNAEQARVDAAARERQVRRDRQARLGRIRAQYASSGLQMEGTPLDVLAADAAQAEQDALLVRHGGQVQSSGYKAKANAYGQAATDSLIGGSLKVGSTLLTGYNQMNPQTTTASAAQPNADYWIEQDTNFTGYDTNLWPNG